MQRLGIVAFVLCHLLVLPASAQTDAPYHWNQEYDPHVAALGLAAGMTSGTGLSVRWPVLPQTMASLTGGAWGESDAVDWNLGLELHYVLRQAGRTRVIVGPGVGAYSDRDADDTNVNASLNVGVEYLFRPRAAFKIDLGFTYLGDDGSVYPLPQAGVYYYF